MASIINASSTGSGGIVQTADASGVLQLQSNGTVALTVNTSGYVAFRDATVGTTALTLRAINNTYTGGALALQDAAGTTKMYLTQIANAMFVGDNTSVDCLVVNQYGLGLGGTAASSGVGIKFPATANLSTNPNTLDDYEEGTWTPTAPVGLSVSTSSYIKIGNTVFINAFINVNANSNATPFVIGSLPFPLATGSASAGAFNNDGGNYYAYMDSVGIYIRDSGNNSQTCAGLASNFVAFQLNYPTTS